MRTRERPLSQAGRWFPPTAPGAGPSPVGGYGKNRRRSGLALIAVLWIALLAGLVLMGVRRAVSVNLATAHGELESVQAHWLARAGVEQAIAILADDSPADDSSLDYWYEDTLAFQEVELDTGVFSVLAPADPDASPATPRFGVEDLSGRVNLNTADKNQLAALPDMDAESDVVAAILDWRDGNETGRPGGAERGYYQGLPFPYQIRNGPFQTRRELRLVRGVDDRLFFGEDTDGDGVLDPNENDGSASPPEDDGDGELDGGLANRLTVYAYTPNEDQLGQPRINVNEASEQDLREQLQFTEPLAEAVEEERGDDGFDSLMELLDVEADSGRGSEEDDEEDGLISEIDLDWLAGNIDRLTISEEDRLTGRINLNTASREVLMTLPQMTEESADAIIQHRRSSGGPFLSAGDLHTAGVVEEERFRQIAEHVTVRSQVFRITSEGVSTAGVRSRITAVVDRGADPARILYWRQSE